MIPKYHLYLLFYPLLLIISSLSFPPKALSQSSGLSLRGGLNLSNLITENKKHYLRSGFHLGVADKLPISGKIYLQAELYFSQQGATLDQEDRLRVNSSYIQMPFLLEYATDHFFIHTGPQVGLLLAATEHEDKRKQNIITQSKNHDFSVCLGLGYWMTEQFGLGSRYSQGLVKTTGVFNSVFQISLMYRPKLQKAS